MNLFYKNKYATNRFKNTIALIIGLIGCETITAQDFVVNTTNDTHATAPATNASDGSGNISLRSALESSTSRTGAHLITFNATVASAGSINLTLGSITVGSTSGGTSITINGPGMNTFTVNQTTGARIFTTGIGAITFILQNIALNYTGPTASTYSGGGGAILAGSAGAVTTLTSVKITNFRQQIGNGGAISASSSSVSHSLTITNCVFSNNACGGGGGAVSYNGIGTATITGTTFSNDSTGIIGSNIGGSGGALSVSGTGNGGTYNVSTCTFTNNTVKNGTAEGGAIINTNGTLTLQYNRFSGNTATDPTLGNTIAQTGGASVNTITANDNWWGRNSGPVANDAVVLAAGGTITITSWLQLRNVPAAATLCATGTGSPASTGFTADILGRNTAPGSVAAANLVGLASFPTAGTVFTNATLGTLSGASTQFVNGIATATYTTSSGNGGTGTVTATADTQNVITNITIPGPPTISPVSGSVCMGSAGNIVNGPAGASSYAWNITNGIITSSQTIQNITYTAGNTSPVSLSLTITSAPGCTTSNSANVTASLTNTLSGTTGGAQVCGNYVVLPSGSGGTTYTDGSCNPIAKVLPSGASPVSGTINTCVKIDATVQTYSATPYVQRHYDITPATNAATATATLTLYYTQTEFNNYNTSRGIFPALPTGPADAAGKAALRVTQYHGTGTAPGNYSGAAALIDPLDANIVWNATASRWEVTFDVVGFSGFYVSTAIFAVPVNLVNFSGQNKGGQNLIEWTTAQEQNSSYFELQRSADGTNFTAISTVNASGNSNSSKTYQYSDNIGSSPLPVYYYRLKMVDLDGKFRYSNIAKIRMISKGFFVEVAPNPFKDQLQLRVNVESAQQDEATITITDMSGKTLLSKTALLKKGNNAITIDEVKQYASGVYLLNVSTSQQKETIKVVKG